MDPPGGDDKYWKLSKKGRSRSGRPHAMDAAGTSTMLSRSYSASVSSTRTATTSSSSSSSSSSSCPQAQAQQQQQGAGQQSSRLSKKKCVEAVKEHRARFYIVRRCVSMLVCWRDH
ncbi:uncharacterized protein LOC120673903 [Panicum virgatum]|uniref:ROTUNDIFOLIA like 8 n=1 Tax=Panicum virgatum TaxID=38727 RepID=A0A8T0SCT1_PANVG|nr:uncharacterized protein LOC120673903 [Panicum virgatum]KAG2594456.1 hypothetical protein PVAP13_5NG647100 [Panicum virgatum]